MSKLIYPYLRSAFVDFLHDKSIHNPATKALKDACESARLPEPDSSKVHLYDRLGIDTVGFMEKYIGPWSNLRKADLIDVVRYWNLTNAPGMNLVMELVPTYPEIALYWTMVNAYETKLFPMFLDEYKIDLPETCPTNLDWITYKFGGPLYALPYQQCFHCGRLEKDPRGKTFGKHNLFYCHVPECITTEPNPSNHPVGCCYGEWKRVKNNLLAACKRVQSNKDKASEIFLAFCEERYKQNLTMRMRGRTQLEKPYDWIRYDDYLSFCPSGLYKATNQ